MTRRGLFLLLSLIVFAAAIAFLAYRPATITGVHASELAKSVADAAGGDRGSCQAAEGDTWLCTTVPTRPAHSATRRYRVTVHGHFGCWKGSAIRASGGHPISGCITIADYF